MPQKTLEQTIRGAGNAARIIGVISLVVSVVAYFAISNKSALSGGSIVLLIISLLIAIGFFVIGQKVYTSPGKDKKNSLIAILCLCILGMILSIINRSFPLIILFLAIYLMRAIQTINKLEKAGITTT